MRFFSPLLLVLTATLSRCHILLPNPAPILVRERQPDSQTIAAWELTGSCFSYFDLNDPERAARPCKKYCKDVEGQDGAVACKGPAEPKEDVDPSIVWQDDDGNDYTPGVCVCEGIEEVAEVFMDIVIEALAELDKVFCAVFLEAFNLVLETGLMAIPGGFPAKVAGEAVGAAVQGAKTVLQNGGEAADFFGGWVGPACGIPEWNFDITMVFGVVNTAPDSMGTSLGCLRKKKKDCKELDPRPDPPKDKPDDKPDDKPSDKPDDSKSTTDAPPATTAPTPTSKTPASTSEAQACQATRAGKNRGRGIDDISLVPAPAVENWAELSKYCNTPLLGAPGMSKRHLGNETLQARAMPPGYGDLDMNEWRELTGNWPGLWTGQIGTCVEIIVTGTNDMRQTARWESFLLYLGLGRNWDDLLGVWGPFEAAVRAKNYRRIESWLYTVNTHPTSPELRDASEEDREYMTPIMQELEATYMGIEAPLQSLTNCGRFTRRTHRFDRVGEAQVNRGGTVGFSPNDGWRGRWI